MSLNILTEILSETIIRTLRVYDRDTGIAPDILFVVVDPVTHEIHRIQYLEKNPNQLELQLPEVRDKILSVIAQAERAIKNDHNH